MQVGISLQLSQSLSRSSSVPLFFLIPNYLRVTFSILILWLSFFSFCSIYWFIPCCYASFVHFKIEVQGDRSSEGKEHEPDIDSGLRGRKWISGVSLIISTALPSSTLFLTLTVFYRNNSAMKFFNMLPISLSMDQVNIQVFLKAHDVFPAEPINPFTWTFFLMENVLVKRHDFIRAILALWR